MRNQILRINSAGCGLALLVMLAGTSAAQEEVQPAETEPPTYLSLNEPEWYAERMAQPAEFAYDYIPLEEAVADIGRRYEVPVRIDAQALGYAGLSPDVPISTQLSGISLDAALGTLLREYDLTWTLGDGMLVITTPAVAEQQLIVRVYPVRDLVTYDLDGVYRYGDGDFQGLSDVILSTCGPTTWDEGTIGLPFHEESGTLVIEQTLEVHRQIEALLEKLRTARQEAQSQSAAALESEELVLAVYRPPPPTGLADVEAWGNDLAAAIEEMVEPASWQAGGGAGRIRAISGVLFVRQTPAMHAQLHSLLNGPGSPRGSFIPEYRGCTPLAPVKG